MQNPYTVFVDISETYMQFSFWKFVIFYTNSLWPEKDIRI